MKNYEVKATRYFKDTVEKVERNINDIFLCDKERYEFLKKNNAVELIGIAVEEADEIVVEIVNEVVESEVVEKAIDEIVDTTVEQIFNKKENKKAKKVEKIK